MANNRIKEALQLAGSQHKYQKTMIALLIIAWIAMMLVFLSSPFLYMDPQFHCQGQGDQPIREKQACEMIDQCEVVDQFTMTSAIGLYCDLEWARVIIQACFPVGSFTGLMVMNLISDTRGRRQAFLISLSVTVVGILLLLGGAFITNPYLLMLSQFMRGFGAESIMPLCYTLCADFLSDKLRPKAIVILNSSGGIVSIVLGFFYLLKLNWLEFTLIFQLIPFLIVLLMFFFYLQQSPYILLDKNRKDEAKKVFSYIARFNGRQDKIQAINRIIDQHQVEQKDQASVQNVLRAVKEWKYIKTIIIMIMVNGIAHMNYLGIAYSFSEVGLGYGYNSMMLGIVQFCSMFFTSYIVANVPRKKGISGFYFLTMMVGLLYFTSFIQQNKVFSTLLIGISRVFSVSANCLIGCLETEAFKTEIQSTAIGLIEGLGLWGAIVAPFIVQLAQNIGLHPMGLVALFVIIAIIPPFFLIETFKRKKDQESQKLNQKDKSQISMPEIPVNFNKGNGTDDYQKLDS